MNASLTLFQRREAMQIGVLVCNDDTFPRLTGRLSATQFFIKCFCLAIVSMYTIYRLAFGCIEKIRLIFVQHFQGRCIGSKTTVIQRETCFCFCQLRTVVQRNGTGFISIFAYQTGINAACPVFSRRFQRSQRGLTQFIRTVQEKLRHSKRGLIPLHTVQQDNTHAGSRCIRHQGIHQLSVQHARDNLIAQHHIARQIGQFLGECLGLSQRNRIYQRRPHKSLNAIGPAVIIIHQCTEGHGLSHLRIGIQETQVDHLAVFGINRQQQQIGAVGTHVGDRHLSIKVVVRNGVQQRIGKRTAHRYAVNGILCAFYVSCARSHAAVDGNSALKRIPVCKIGLVVQEVLAALIVGLEVDFCQIHLAAGSGGVVNCALVQILPVAAGIIVQLAAVACIGGNIELDAIHIIIHQIFQIQDHALAQIQRVLTIQFIHQIFVRAGISAAFFHQNDSDSAVILITVVILGYIVDVFLMQFAVFV